jgi:hypothetical protein
MKITIGTDSILRKKSESSDDVTVQEDHDSSTNPASTETNSTNQSDIARNLSKSKASSSKFPFSFPWKLDESEIDNKSYKNNSSNGKE